MTLLQDKKESDSRLYKLVEQEPQRVVKSRLRGIPDWVFRAGFEETVVGNSGKRRFKCSIGSSHVYIDADNDKDNFHFYARVDEGVLSFGIKTQIEKVNGKIKRDSDLFAHDLALRSLAFFEAQGNKILIIEHQWHNIEHIDTEYKAFERYITKYSKPGAVMNEVIRQAVFSTWSGKLAKELGFAEIAPQEGKLVHIDESGERVVVHLKRTERIRLEFDVETRNKHAELFFTIRSFLQSLRSKI